MKEPSQFLPFLPNFSSFSRFLPDFSRFFGSFSRFLASFLLTSPPCPILAQFVLYLPKMYQICSLLLITIHHFGDHQYCLKVLYIFLYDKQGNLACMIIYIQNNNHTCQNYTLNKHITCKYFISYKPIYGCRDITQD